MGSKQRPICVDNITNALLKRINSLLVYWLLPWASFVHHNYVCEFKSEEDWRRDFSDPFLFLQLRWLEEGGGGILLILQTRQGELPAISPTPLPLYSVA